MLTKISLAVVLLVAYCATTMIVGYLVLEFSDLYHKIAEKRRKYGKKCS